MQGQAVISVEGLYKHYGQVKAVDGVSFEICEREIFGMVGPNGSGKTTTIECIEGLRQPDQGRLRVLGLDPRRDFYALRERIGVQLQSSNLPRACGSRRRWSCLLLSTARRLIGARCSRS